MVTSTLSLSLSLSLENRKFTKRIFDNPLPLETDQSQHPLECHKTSGITQGDEGGSAIIEDDLNGEQPASLRLRSSSVGREGKNWVIR